MLISFIIPVYNVENYITECVNSILKQNFCDYEIILVDDGSTDSSGVICERFAELNNRIHVIHKRNGGLSDARNAGIKEAKGEYILFVDSDDYIAENSVNNIFKMLEKTKNVDVMFLNAEKFYPDGKRESLGDGYNSDCIIEKEKAQVMQHLASLPKFPGSACTKLIKKAVIDDNNLYFEKNLISEDIDWTIGMLCAANSFSYCDCPYYNYRQKRKGSITNTSSVKSVKGLLFTIEKWSSRDLTKPFQKEINSFLAYEYMIALYNYVYLPLSDKKTVKKKLKKYGWLLKYGQSSKTKICNLCYTCAGLKGTSLALRLKGHWPIKKKYI